MARLLACIQARTGSSRLPGKVLEDLAGKPMLARVVERVRRTVLVDEVVVATTTAKDDDRIEALCGALGIPCFRCSELDVLDRYYRAAAERQAAAIVRITADCPFIDSHIVNEVAGTYFEGGYDYAANINPPTYPDGLDTEVFSFAALETAWREARLASEREHVTLYIRNHPERFRIGNVCYRRDLSRLRWVVDEPRDLEFAAAVYEQLGERAFGMADILDLLRDKPELAFLNAGIRRDEGLMKSLELDRIVV